MKFMKSICFVLCFILIFVLGGCDNNEGPFELRRENGTLILYSNDKPAKGWVVENNIDYTTGITVKSSEIEYKKGIPTGNFKFYNSNGEILIEGILKKDENIYKGLITFGLDKKNKITGELALNSNWIINGEHNLSLINFYEMFHEKEIIINGTIDTTVGKGSYKNAKKEGIWETYYTTGKLLETYNCINGKIEGEYKAFYNNGDLHINANFKDGKLNGIYEEYDYDRSKKHYIKNRLFYVDGDLRKLEFYSEYKKLFLVEEYLNGKLHGKTTKLGGLDYMYGGVGWPSKIIEIYEHGILIRHEIYGEDGTLKSEKNY